MALAICFSVDFESTPYEPLAFKARVVQLLIVIHKSGIGNEKHG